MRSVAAVSKWLVRRGSVIMNLIALLFVNWFGVRYVVSAGMSLEELHTKDSIKYLN